MSYTLGRIGIVARGAYAATKTYDELDMVTYDGSSYVAMQETTGNPPTNTQYWMEMARKGDPGRDNDSVGDMLKAVYDQNNDGIVNRAALADMATDAMHFGGMTPDQFVTATSTVTISIPASAWTGAAAPYYATATVSGVPADGNNVWVGLSDTATDEQYAAAAAAQMWVTRTGWAAGRIALVARGDKPAVALPVTVKIGG